MFSTLPSPLISYTPSPSLPVLIPSPFPILLSSAWRYLLLPGVHTFPYERTKIRRFLAFAPHPRQTTSESPIEIPNTPFARDSRI
ncbi:MAG: hypothetical protein NXY57DRAFT_964371 [Lentinula lateritia]|uniref:Uncharacterized protein n=1 Tax=Lentinula lateritia TaxID=40482 RepID=A0ABQ8VYE5_9AGAR|nr:MAG: hypothetical protein NXY57DRAFT_964371 [Lentinula lateritia]KAJ4501339.1 hypothetical protein C8R41DRAFT_913355 [Lentinula lateritia]